MRTDDKILVSEIFGPTIQGEGALVGRPTVFVRTGGCDFRCAWCDSMHAVAVENRAHWLPMTPQEILTRVHELTDACGVLITLSGGNPALQPMEELIDLGHACGHTFALETQGSVAQKWFDKLDHLILSPKPPSSLMPFRETRLQDCIDAARTYRVVGSPALAGVNVGPQLSLKVVVMTENDYHFARIICERFAKPNCIPFFITPGNHTPPAGAKYNVNKHEFDTEGVLARTRWIVERLRQDRWFDVSVIPQLHTLIWQNQQGV